MYIRRAIQAFGQHFLIISKQTISDNTWLIVVICISNVILSLESCSTLTVNVMASLGILEVFVVIYILAHNYDFVVNCCRERDLAPIETQVLRDRDLAPIETPGIETSLL
jgi:hypothetical protein